VLRAVPPSPSRQISIAPVLNASDFDAVLNEVTASPMPVVSQLQRNKYPHVAL